MGTPRLLRIQASQVAEIVEQSTHRLFALRYWLLEQDVVVLDDPLVELSVQRQ